MNRLRIICTVTGLLLAMGGLAHAAEMDVTLTPNPAAQWTYSTITVIATDIDVVKYSLDGYRWYDLVESSDGTYTLDIYAGYVGIREMIVRGLDDNGNVVAEESILLVVYNSDGGFVTGAGWIDSPEGAYMPDGVPTSLTGRAHFAFVSKYKKGATTPTGPTSFVFKAGDFNFNSSSYAWLIVNQNGTNAQFKGEGTINGEGDYIFMVWAHDDKDNYPDAFRIKIWKKEDEEVVYDNEEEQTIESGNIIIHGKFSTCPYCGGDPCVPPCDGSGTGEGA